MNPQEFQLSVGFVYFILVITSIFLLPGDCDITTILGFQIRDIIIGYDVFYGVACVFSLFFLAYQNTGMYLFFALECIFVIVWTTLGYLVLYDRVNAPCSSQPLSIFTDVNLRINTHAIVYGSVYGIYRFINRSCCEYEPV